MPLNTHVQRLLTRWCAAVPRRRQQAVPQIILEMFGERYANYLVIFYPSYASVATADDYIASVIRSRVSTFCGRTCIDR